MLHSDIHQSYLYNSGPLMYVHICIEMRCLVTGRKVGRKRAIENEREERAEGRRESERGIEEGRGGDEIWRKAQTQMISQDTLPHDFVHVLYSYLLAFPE